jgi:hypothetical protein
VRFFPGGIFSIDDGEPRKIDDPNEKQLLDAFGKGFVPEPYARGAKDVDLHVIEEKCTYEEYMAKKKTQKEEAKDEEDLLEKQILEQVLKESLALHEKEQMDKQQQKPSDNLLAPAIVVNAPVEQPSQVETAPVKEEKKVQEETNAKPTFTYQVDKTQPFTSVQFKFGNGAKTVLQINTAEKVEQLYKFIAASEQAPTGKFELVRQYPVKVLSEMDATIKDMALENGVVLVKQVGK